MKKDFVKSLKVKFEKFGGYLIWLLIILLAMSTVRNIGKMKRIRGEIDKEKEKIAKMDAENKSLAVQLSNTQTPEFIEKEIRNKLGLVKEGEFTVILPDDEVLRKLAPKINTEQDSLPDPNWKKWAKLFF